MFLQKCRWLLRLSLLLSAGVLFSISVWAAPPASSRPSTTPVRTKTKKKPQAKATSRSASRPAPRLAKTGHKKATKKPTSRPKKSLKTVKCKRPSIMGGRYCLGRTIGPRVQVRSKRCPLGGERIRLRVITKLKARGRDSDLRPHLGRFGQKDYIWICPGSNYAALPRDFFRPFDKARVRRALKPLKRKFRDEKSIPGWFRYQAAAAVYWARKKKARFFGSFFLRAMWAAREEGAKLHEQRFRMRAIAAMRIALKRKQYPAVKQPTVLYLIAELYRQAGKWKEATRWFEKAYNTLQVMRKRRKNAGKSLERVILSGRARTDKRDAKIYPLP